MIIKDNGFIHHVFFWLKNAENKKDREALITGLNELLKVPEIKNFHIGVPADTNRDVIENTYSVSWLLLFENAADQEIYQQHPIHLKFVEDCSSLWKKVVVYDTVSVL